MDTKKRLTILIVVAIILAVTAIVMSVMDSEVSTVRSPSTGVGQSGAGIIGVDIVPGEVEDKLLSGEGQ